VHNPELHSLSQVGWQFFCTLTFKSEKLSDRVRAAMFFQWVRTQGLNSGVHFSKLLWCLRRELGEATKRLHLHVTIAGLPSHYRNRMTCMAMMATWEKCGGGMARVRVYDQSLDGLDYFLKVGSGLSCAFDAMDYHELSKFGGSCEVMLSKSVIRHLDNRLRLGHRAMLRETRGKETASGTVHKKLEHMARHGVRRKEGNIPLIAFQLEEFNRKLDLIAGYVGRISPVEIPTFSHVIHNTL
jgi:hypothetical protein